MAEAMFTCPRCALIAPLRSDMRFCPRCGLTDAVRAFLDRSPLNVTTEDGRQVRVLDRIDYGSISSIYRCEIHDGDAAGGATEGIFKIARDVRTNDLIANEAEVLRQLHLAPDAARHSPFLPALAGEAHWPERNPPNLAARRGNVLCYDAQIRSPADDLYTLHEVRARYRAGLDPRDMAWIWRRLLAVLGFVHARQVVHGAVLPMHVLIDPRDHKLVLIDWCCARFEPDRVRRPLMMITGGYGPWYDAEVRGGAPPTFGLDIAMGARCMIELTGGNPIAGRMPRETDPALQRYFDRCLAPSTRPADAWKLLDHFDRLIEALWGPRMFREMLPPGKRRQN